jgi:hypothetical protein
MRKVVLLFSVNIFAQAARLALKNALIQSASSLSARKRSTAAVEVSKV